MENKKKTIGQKASTTGTIYGIYDMNGNYSWVLRGYSYLSSSYVGLFGFNRDNGSGNVINNYTFRSTLVK